MKITIKNIQLIILIAILIVVIVGLWTEMGKKYWAILHILNSLFFVTLLFEKKEV